MDKMAAQDLINTTTARFLMSRFNLMPFVASPDQCDWDRLVDALVALGLGEAAMALQRAITLKFKYYDGRSVEDKDFSFD